ncbi:MAG: OmpA family protein [Bacteroidia bacterium]|nr:OmpA family protein [Bacteroidia bacterium]
MKLFANPITTGAMLFLLISVSCVPVRQYQDMKTRNTKCEEERDYLKNLNKELTEKSAETDLNTSKYQKRLDALQLDTLTLGTSLRKMIVQYDKINQLNDELMSKLKLKNIESSDEAKKLLVQLQQLQEILQKKEDDLKKMEKDLNEKKANLDELTTQIDEKNSALEKKNARLIELEGILSRKDSMVKVLKDKVSNALQGYEGKGLTVVQKNGKVYVSLDEKLLFQSGKWDVDPKGQKALKDLAVVLEKNNDINIVIEGHTDDVTFKGTNGIEDNWDLSAKRATAIVKILLSNSKIDAKRLMAAGRSQYLPVDPSKTPEARTKNRRTEIILTPKLDELFKVLESN